MKDNKTIDYFSEEYDKYLEDEHFRIPSFLIDVLDKRFCMPSFLYELLSTPEPEQVVKKQVR